MMTLLLFPMIVGLLAAEVTAHQPHRIRLARVLSVKFPHIGVLPKVAVDRSGNIYIVHSHNRLQKFSPSGELIRDVSLGSVRAISVGLLGDHLYIGMFAAGTTKIAVCSTDGELLNTIPLNGFVPREIIPLKKRSLYVAGFFAERSTEYIIKRIDVNGQVKEQPLKISLYKAAAQGLGREAIVFIDPQTLMVVRSDGTAIDNKGKRYRLHLQHEPLGGYGYEVTRPTYHISLAVYESGYLLIFVNEHFSPKAARDHSKWMTKSYLFMLDRNGKLLAESSALAAIPQFRGDDGYFYRFLKISGTHGQAVLTKFRIDFSEFSRESINRDRPLPK